MDYRLLLGLHFKALQYLKSYISGSQNTSSEGVVTVADVAVLTFLHDSVVGLAPSDREKFSKFYILVCIPFREMRRLKEVEINTGRESFVFFCIY